MLRTFKQTPVPWAFFDWIFLTVTYFAIGKLKFVSVNFDVKYFRRFEGVSPLFLYMDLIQNQGSAGACSSQRVVPRFHGRSSGQS